MDKLQFWGNKNPLRRNNTPGFFWWGGLLVCTYMYRLINLDDLKQSPIHPPFLE